MAVTEPIYFDTSELELTFAEALLWYPSRQHYLLPYSYFCKGFGLDPSNFFRDYCKFYCGVYDDDVDTYPFVRIGRDRYIDIDDCVIIDLMKAKQLCLPYALPENPMDFIQPQLKWSVVMDSALNCHELDADLPF